MIQQRSELTNVMCGLLTFLLMGSSLCLALMTSPLKSGLYTDTSLFAPSPLTPTGFVCCSWMLLIIRRKGTDELCYETVLVTYSRMLNSTSVWWVQELVQLRGISCISLDLNHNLSGFSLSTPNMKPG